MWEYNATIYSVYDGDTLRANVDLGFRIWTHGVPFRLARINAPELIKSDPRGRVARDYVLATVPVDSEVQIRTYKDEQEKYGRYLADIYPEGFDGFCVNDRLVELGYALYWDGKGVRPT